MFRSLIWLFAAVAALFPCTVRAEGPAPVSVGQLVAEALEKNAELRYYEAALAVAKGGRTQAGLWKNPELSGDYGSRRVTDSTGILQGDGFTRSIALVQTFEFPGKGSLRKAVANKDVEIAELGVRQFRLALAGKVRNLALGYAAASVHASDAEEVAERSAALVALLRERPAAGTSQLLELRLIEGSLGELRKTARESILAREEARIELNGLLGRPASQPLALKIAVSPPARKLDASWLVLDGLNGNLQLKVRIAELEKAVRQVSAARLDVAPDFAVGPFFSQDKAGDNEENFGGTLSVTLPLWDWNQGNIAAAKARRDQADALLLDARRRVEAEILRRVRSYELFLGQLEGTPADLVPKLREAADLADRQYRTGAVGVQLFLEVQREFLAAHQLRNEAVLGAWRDLFDLELLAGESASGVLP
jgi:cobalt-zinc-cadmium efflux system outer membrane protein